MRLVITAFSMIAMAAAPAPAQVIFADGFESGDTSAWSDAVGLRYELGHRTVTWLDAARGNRSAHTEVYYPAAAAGDDVPVAAGSFPVVVCGHGYTMDAASPRSLAEALVPLGFIVVLPDTETGLFPSHDDFGKDIAFLARTLQDEGAAPSSPFFGRWKIKQVFGDRVRPCAFSRLISPYYCFAAQLFSCRELHAGKRKSFLRRSSLAENRSL